MLNDNIETFVMHISFLKSRITIYLARKAWMALLLAKKTIDLAKYSNFAEVFLKESANVVLEQTGVNEHAIELKKGKQPPYRPIYSLGPFKLKTLKTYIETNFANSFIWTSKSLASALILFVNKRNSSLHLCINYQKLNNLIIKNRYLLPLINKSLDLLGQAKKLIQLHLTSAYYWMRIKKADK